VGARGPRRRWRCSCWGGRVAAGHGGVRLAERLMALRPVQGVRVSLAGSGGAEAGSVPVRERRCPPGCGSGGVVGRTGPPASVAGPTTRRGAAPGERADPAVGEDPLDGAADGLFARPAGEALPTRAARSVTQSVLGAHRATTEKLTGMGASTSAASGVAQRPWRYLRPSLTMSRPRTPGVDQRTPTSVRRFISPMTRSRTPVASSGRPKATKT